jgi:6-phosphogluconate dehydrogenase (decarboxylating)
MQLGMIGLGRMGANMVRRLLARGHECVVFARSPKVVNELVQAGAVIGGEAEVVTRLDPIFASLAPGAGSIPRTPGREKANGTSEQGYLHCGPNGAGHFVKMVHNGIEYGLMAAYAEGLGILRAASIGTRGHDVHAEATPLRDPEHYQS